MSSQDFFDSSFQNSFWDFCIFPLWFFAETLLFSRGFSQSFFLMFLPEFLVKYLQKFVLGFLLELVPVFLPEVLLSFLSDVISEFLLECLAWSFRKPLPIVFPVISPRGSCRIYSLYLFNTYFLLVFPGFFQKFLQKFIQVWFSKWFPDFLPVFLSEILPGFSTRFLSNFHVISPASRKSFRIFFLNSSRDFF